MFQRLSLSPSPGVDAMNDATTCCIYTHRTWFWLSEHRPQKNCGWSRLFSDILSWRNTRRSRTVSHHNPWCLAQTFWQASSHWSFITVIFFLPLMIEAKTVSKMLDTTSTFTWLTAQEDFIVYHKTVSKNVYRSLKYNKILCTQSDIYSTYICFHVVMEFWFINLCLHYKTQ
jgi:hypothetical protein